MRLPNPVDTDLRSPKMKITDLQTFVVANPPPHYGGLYFIFVKLTTDSDI